MLLAYNIVFNLHIMPVNFMIWFKELMLEIFPPMLQQDDGDELDLQDVEESISPITWWMMFVNGRAPDQQLPTESKPHH